MHTHYTYTQRHTQAHMKIWLKVCVHEGLIGENDKLLVSMFIVILYEILKGGEKEKY